MTHFYRLTFLYLTFSFFQLVNIIARKIMKLTNFSRGPESKSFPIEFASDLNLFEQFPSEYSPQDFSPPPPKYPSMQFNHFNGGFKGGGRIKHKPRSWLDMINPFECETDDDELDYGDL